MVLALPGDSSDAVDINAEQNADVLRERSRGKVGTSYDLLHLMKWEKRMWTVIGEDL